MKLLSIALVLRSRRTPKPPPAQPLPQLTPEPPREPKPEKPEIRALTLQEEVALWRKGLEQRYPRPRPWEPADEERVLERLAAETRRLRDPRAAALKLFGGRR